MRNIGEVSSRLARQMITGLQMISLWIAIT